MNQYEKKLAQAAIRADPAWTSFDEVFSRISMEIGISAREVENVLNRLVVQGILWRRGGPSRRDQRAAAGWHEKGDSWLE